MIEEVPFREQNAVASPLYTSHMTEEAIIRDREKASKPIDWSRLNDWASLLGSDKQV